MVLLTAENIRKSYGTRVIFDDISFSIHEGDKIGVIGVNGTGKSTLLKIIAGVDQADSGSIVTMNGMRIGYLSQSPVFVDGTTVLQQVFRGENPQLALVREYEETMAALAKTPEEERLVKRAAELAEKMDKAEAWSLESEAKTILTKLGISDFGQTVETLSGGQKKRVALAAALIAPVDLLILDEPTNHIDNDTVDWLEKHLEKYSKALLMVTHDRYFLDRVANRTLELEQGKLYSYQANYSKFLEMKAEREELIAAGERKRQNFLRTELEWVRRGAQARSTKQKARLQRFEEVSAIRAPEEKQSVELSSVGSRLGKKTIALRNICNGSMTGKRTSRISATSFSEMTAWVSSGITGCGKSTLLNIMTGRLKPDSGEVEIGETVKIGVFAQENVDMDEKQRVIDYIRDEAEIIRTADGHITASQMLDRFLFPPSMQRGPISVLSGGERRRLYLCRVLMGAPNILFLDEPTNDLDIETLMILEEYLEHFNGAVVAVSHDRYFLDKTMGRIFAFLGNGRIKQYEGGYSDCKAAREKEAPVFTEKAVKVKREEPQKEKAPVKKMSYKDQREYDTIGDEIAALEEKIAKTDADMAACATDFTHLQELSAEKEALEAKLEERMERWMELSELAEEIERNKA